MAGGPPIYSGPILDGKLVVETAQSAYEAGRRQRFRSLSGRIVRKYRLVSLMPVQRMQLLNLFGSMKDEAKSSI